MRRSFYQANKRRGGRRFCQVLLGSRRGAYEEFRHRLGITNEQVWLSQTKQAEVVLLSLEAEHPEQLIAQLAASDCAFDCWLREQLLELHGVDLVQLTARTSHELIFVWQP